MKSARTSQNKKGVSRDIPANFGFNRGQEPSLTEIIRTFQIIDLLVTDDSRLVGARIGQLEQDYRNREKELALDEKEEVKQKLRSLKRLHRELNFYVEIVYHHFELWADKSLRTYLRSGQTILGEEFVVKLIVYARQECMCSPDLARRFPDVYLERRGLKIGDVLEEIDNFERALRKVIRLIANEIRKYEIEESSLEEQFGLIESKASRVHSQVGWNVASLQREFALHTMRSTLEPVGMFVEPAFQRIYQATQPVVRLVQTVSALMDSLLVNLTKYPVFEQQSAELQWYLDVAVPRDTILDGEFPLLVKIRREGSSASFYEYPNEEFYVSSRKLNIVWPKRSDNLDVEVVAEPSEKYRVSYPKEQCQTITLRRHSDSEPVHFRINPVYTGRLCVIVLARSKKNYHFGDHHVFIFIGETDEYQLLPSSYDCICICSFMVERIKDLHPLCFFLEDKWASRYAYEKLSPGKLKDQSEEIVQIAKTNMEVGELVFYLCKYWLEDSDGNEKVPREAGLKHQLSLYAQECLMKDNKSRLKEVRRILKML
jgi:hypothetical protein